MAGNSFLFICIEWIWWAGAVPIPHLWKLWIANDCDKKCQFYGHFVGLAIFHNFEYWLHARMTFEYTIVCCVCVCRAHFATLLGIQRLKRGLYKRKYDKLIVFDSICLVSQSTIAVSLGCFFYLTTAPWEWILTPHSTKAIRQAERGRRELLNEEKKNTNRIEFKMTVKLRWLVDCWMDFFFRAFTHTSNPNHILVTRRSGKTQLMNNYSCFNFSHRKWVNSLIASHSFAFLFLCSPPGPSNFISFRRLFPLRCPLLSLLVVAAAHRNCWLLNSVHWNLTKFHHND